MPVGVQVVRAAHLMSPCSVVVRELEFENIVIVIMPVIWWRPGEVLFFFRVTAKVATYIFPESKTSGSSIRRTVTGSGSRGHDSDSESKATTFKSAWDGNRLMVPLSGPVPPRGLLFPVPRPVAGSGAGWWFQCQMN